MRDIAPERLPAGLPAAFAAFAVFLALLNNFLRFEQYPFLRLEVLYTVLAGAIFASLFGIVYQLAGKLPKSPRRIIHAILVGALVGYPVGILTTYIYAFVAAIAVGTAAFMGRDVIGPVALMACVSMLAASIGIGQQAQAPFTQSGKSRPGVFAKPAIVHIIFDEHIGLEGLPKADPETPHLRQAILAFYLAHGFELFGGAYSRNLKTISSVPYFLNFGEAPRLKQLDPAKGNAYFALLKKSGYRINVLQSEWIDYCSRLVDECTTYQSQSYAGIANARLSNGEKAVLIGRKMVPAKISDAVETGYRWLSDASFHSPVPAALMRLAPTPMNGLAALRRLRHELTGLQMGQVYFAHILLPHNPYVLHADCSIAPLSEWRLGDRGRGQPMLERQEAYAAQALCATRELGLILKTIESSPAAGNAIVIVHGDHGSRISDRLPMAYNVGKFGDEDLIAGYSTLFAFRAPGITPGYEPAHYPLADLLHELAISDFRKTGSHAVGRPFVFLTDQNSAKRVRVALPPTW